MRIYHGSTIEINKPDIIDAERGLDFGPGFYTTKYISQAEIWAKNKNAQFKSFYAVVNIYDINMKLASKELQVNEFKGMSNAWLDFIIENRKTVNLIHNYDICIGEVANDRVYRAIALYEAGEISKDELIKRVKFKYKNNQISFHTINALKKLKYIGSRYC